jgi:hypothetical protein
MRQIQKAHRPILAGHGKSAIRTEANGSDRYARTDSLPHAEHGYKVLAAVLSVELRLDPGSNKVVQWRGPGISFHFK